MKNAAFDIRDFGARENIAPAANRAATNRAIQAASAAGGGRVVVPPGEWRTGTVELRSGVELHLQKGAVLKGSDRQADYNADDAYAFTISKLKANEPYTLYLYSANGNSPGNAAFTVGGATKGVEGLWMLGAAVVPDAPGHAAVKARGGDGEVNHMPCTP